LVTSGSLDRSRSEAHTQLLQQGACRAELRGISSGGSA